MEVNKREVVYQRGKAKPETAEAILGHPNVPAAILFKLKSEGVASDLFIR